MYQLLQKENYEITKILNYTSNNWVIKIVSYYTQVKICSIERDPDLPYKQEPLGNVIIT